MAFVQIVVTRRFVLGSKGLVVIIFQESYHHWNDTKEIVDTTRKSGRVEDANYASKEAGMKLPLLAKEEQGRQNVSMSVDDNTI